MYSKGCYVHKGYEIHVNRQRVFIWIPLLVCTIIALAYLWLPPETSVLAADDTPRDGVDIAELYRRASPSVVSIKVEIGRFDVASGAGFVVDNNGYIVTNTHVVEDALNILIVFHDGAEAPAELVGIDTLVDIAVIKVDVDPNRLEPVAYGNSDDLAVGQSVLAIGNPFGLEGTLTTGIISGLNRSITFADGSTMDAAIQTDAALGRGNSGGPLINQAGEVIGVNTAGYTGLSGSSNFGFAIPSNLARRISENMIAQRVERSHMTPLLRLNQTEVAELLATPRPWPTLPPTWMAVPTLPPAVTPTDIPSPTATPPPTPVPEGYVEATNPNEEVVAALLELLPKSLPAGEEEWKWDYSRGDDGIGRVRGVRGTAVATRAYYRMQEGGLMNLDFAVFDTAEEAKANYDRIFGIRSVLENGKPNEDFPQPNIFGAGLYSSVSIFQIDNYFIEVFVELFTRGSPLVPLSGQTIRFFENNREAFEAAVMPPLRELCRAVVLNLNSITVRARPTTRTGTPIVGYLPTGTVVSILKQEREERNPVGGIWYFINVEVDEGAISGWIRNDTVVPDRARPCPPFP